MNILVVDFETTGLDPVEDDPVEVAAILYSLEHRAVLQSAATLLPTLDDGPCAVNGITGEAARELLPDSVLNAIETMALSARYIVAYNSEFDRQWCEKAGLPVLAGRRWADAAEIRYPVMDGGKSLVVRAIVNDVAVVSAHRAMDDCDILIRLLTKVPNLEAELVRVSQPRKLYRAVVGYGDRQVAKDAGFYWDSLVPKAWARRCFESDVAELPFEVVEVLS